jgi:Zn-dependent M28 family amino/carboxypeptidase
LLSVLIPISTINAEPIDYIEEIIGSIDEELVRDYTQDLVDFGPKITGSEACMEAENYVFDELQKTGLITEYHPWISGEFEGRNIEAILPGESEKSFIICAHLDTVEGSPGADDDCTGVAAVLTAAKSISENMGDMVFVNTIRFVIFTGTEQLHLGSYNYSSDLNEQGIDVIGVIEAHLLGFIGDSDDGNINMNVVKNKYMSEWIADVAESTATSYNDLIDLTINRQNAVGSYGDRYSFEVFRDSFTFFSAFYFNTDVHTPEDTIDKLDFEYAARLTRLITATTLKISNDDFEKSTTRKTRTASWPFFR